MDTLLSTRSIGISDLRETPARAFEQADETAVVVLTPGLIDRLGLNERYTLAVAFGLHFPANGQPCLAVEQIDAFVIDARMLRTQQVMNHAVARAPSRVRNLGDLVAQRGIEFTG